MADKDPKYCRYQCKPADKIAAEELEAWTEVTTLNVERPASCESALRGQQHQPID